MVFEELGGTIQNLPFPTVGVDFENVHLGKLQALNEAYAASEETWSFHENHDPWIPTTIKTMGVNITTIACLRVSIIEIGSTIILMVVEAQGWSWPIFLQVPFFVANIKAHRLAPRSQDLSVQKYSTTSGV